MADIIFDIKDSITDNQFKLLMETLGGREQEPDWENVKVVKLTYIYCEYVDVNVYLADREDICIARGGPLRGFIWPRLKRLVKTKIVEVYGNDAEPQESLSTTSLNYSRLHVSQLKRFKRNLPEGCASDCWLQLDQTRWIHPLDLTVIS